MRKIDIFDEIIATLKRLEEYEPTADVPESEMAKLFAAAPERPIKRATAPEIPAAAPQIPETPVPAVPETAPAQQTPAQQTPAAPAAESDWDGLREATQKCRKCDLCQTRRNVVFGDGNPGADLMFIGEGPGESEDAQGLPFVGRAGELLTRMIAAMGFDRKRDVYIANIVKCRPPGNRNPEEVEAMACLPYLERQIELIKPKVIVLLGAVPLLYLLKQRGITRLHGQWFEYRGIKTLATFHPAFLLRDPRKKVEAWSDLQVVMREFGKTVPRK